MDYFPRHELRKINPHTDEYMLIIYVDQNLTEFADELGMVTGEKKDLLTVAKQIAKERYPALKIALAKVMVGGMVLTSIPLVGATAISAKAAEPTSSTQVSQSNSIYYHVSSGDTLWILSRKFNTSIDNIKRANHLTSDVLQINQRLIIPKAIHTVGTGDYLTVLAKKYGTTTDAIKQANGLTSDETFLGQTLIIPTLIESQTTKPAPTVTEPKEEATTYTVVSGDSLSVIAKRFGTTVDALRSANHLTTDVIRIGQVLVIPGAKTPAPSTNKEATSYTVVAGDSLSVIAKKFNVSVNQLKQANHLTSDIILVGQVLTIPGATQPNAAETPVRIDTNDNLTVVQKNLKELGYYAVPTMTGSYDATTTAAIKNFQADYGLNVTGKIDTATMTAIDHAIVKKALTEDATRYLGVPYKWGGTTPAGFDCSGFVYYMFNQHGVNMARNTSSGLAKMGTGISKSKLQPGDLVFFAVNNPNTISHVGFYMGNNQFISATSSKGIAVASMNDSYWSKYYVGAKRVY